MKKKHFPGGLECTHTCSVGDLGFNPWVGKIPWRRACNPLQYPCQENPHGQRSLVGYSPWGHKESDMTEPLSTYICKKKDYFLVAIQ